jgi:hypothetical protein
MPAASAFRVVPSVVPSPQVPDRRAVMNVRSFSPILILVSLLTWGALALASADPQQLTIRGILTQQTQLRVQVVAGKGAFKDMSKAERAALACIGN